MTGILNDRYKISLMLATLFVLGAGVTLYLIYSLPGGLQLARGYEPEFLNVYIAIGVTFLIGALSLNNALRYKQEIIVFRDRALEDSLAQQEAAQAGKTTISLETVTASLTHAKGEKEILQAGLQAICKQLDAGQGAVYRIVEEDGKRFAELKTGYALSLAESTVIRFEFGEGLIGQAAANGTTLYVDDVPEGYIKIVSGLGSASPKFLLIQALKKTGQVVGILEIASFNSISEDQRKFVEEAATLIADKITQA
ncbi:GAF domain-containing protein [Chryseolinea lacunae]|uniref:GAF domain-containing protein n=1 Tax=Chryseolinea lacunae TaxID=2801331 RepID=A0ABS1KQA3_9BACT|nr:GAF domain-containing protein [Chryseolinea lacunae]MBL0740872.1 GAF domain-containing protein [Chryseolinea lacunae]